VTFFQSGGCCDGSSPICLGEGVLAPGPHDRLLGEVAGAPFYIDAEQDDRWNRPLFVLDLAAGPPEGFSLAGPGGTHFVSRSPEAACGVSDGRSAARRRSASSGRSRTPST
jgi:uncharacterized protein